MPPFSSLVGDGWNGRGIADEGMHVQSTIRTWASSLLTIAICVAVTGGVAVAAAPGGGTAPATVPIRERNLDAARDDANKLPRAEKDQTLTDGWPLYRNHRGQQAFNDAMATLKATDTAAPAAEAFKRCPRLECNLVLPAMVSDGFIPAGRMWVSPTEYVLFVTSQRNSPGRPYARNSRRDMRYFVFHEFHNSSRNTDAYDTIASHRRSVFVPFYMTKQSTDAKGRSFVVVIQVAPHDVDSVHATNWGSAGPGIEVAKNSADELQPLQALAGILVASFVKNAAPQLKIVNHRGSEGRPMLDAYEQRRERLAEGRSATRAMLPFIPATEQRLATATARLEELIQRPGLPAPRTPVAERSLVPPKPTLLWQR